MKEEVKLRTLIVMLSVFALSGIVGGISSLQKVRPNIAQVNNSTNNLEAKNLKLEKDRSEPKSAVLGETDAKNVSPTLVITPKLIVTATKTPTPTPLPSPTIKKIAGDVNGDNRVDLQDAAIWIAQYRGDSSAKTADLNRDGKVDLQDFELIRAGIINPPKPIPTTNLGPCDSKTEIECISSPICKAIYLDGSLEAKFARCVRATVN